MLTMSSPEYFVKQLVDNRITFSIFRVKKSKSDAQIVMPVLFKFSLDLVTEVLPFSSEIISELH